MLPYDSLKGPISHSHVHYVLRLKELHVHQVNEQWIIKATINEKVIIESLGMTVFLQPCYGHDNIQALLTFI